MKEKVHLTKEGFTKFKQLKDGMNTGRRYMSTYIPTRLNTPRVLSFGG